MPSPIIQAAVLGGISPKLFEKRINYFHAFNFTNFSTKKYFVKMKLLCTSLLFSLFALANLFSQNLILNPGFEEHDKSLVDTSSFRYEFSHFGVKNWSVPNESFSWFVDSTSKNYENEKGYEEINPYAGNAFVGLCLYAPFNARFYLQGEFSKPLQAGKRYKFTIHVALGQYSTYNIDQFGVFFGQNKVLQPVKNEITWVTPQLILNVSNIFPRKLTWVEISGFYTATGNEKYFIIGNFRKTPDVNKNMDPKKPVNPKTELGTFYWVDDLSMKETTENEEIAIGPGKILLKDIHFKSGDSTIVTDSYVALNEIVTALKKQPALKVDVYGHTDNTGSAAQNQKLSEARARAVAVYFISHGIDKSRITTKGYGSSKPISSDQSKNRRVEFIFK